MGSVELLSREGEIAIAKRIEAGRDTMIRGLCESALTFEAIMVWREELGTGRILLREVIDLDATYGVLNPSSLPHNQPQPPIPGQPVPPKPEPEEGAAPEADPSAG
jgi:RNA polymerase primary sigma factor